MDSTSMEITRKRSSSPRKTVEFAQEVELRIIDADDGSVVGTETHDLSSYATLNKAARQIDKELFFLHPNYEHEITSDLLESRPPWGYLALDQLQRDYQRRGTEQDIEVLALVCFSGIPQQSFVERELIVSSVHRSHDVRRARFSLLSLAL
jgi:hypothetical protein